MAYNLDDFPSWSVFITVVYHNYEFVPLMCLEEMLPARAPSYNSHAVTHRLLVARQGDTTNPS